VAAPTSTFDFDLNSGDGIHIEERDARELLPACYLDDGSPIDAWNPVFDVTPAELITTIVTERGAIMQPGRHGVGSLAPC